MAVRSGAVVTDAVLPTLPLFTLAGYFLAESGASKRLLAVFEAVVGQFRGGPAIVTCLVCAFFTTFTGASGVTKSDSASAALAGRRKLCEKSERTPMAGLPPMRPFRPLQSKRSGGPFRPAFNLADIRRPTSPAHAYRAGAGFLPSGWPKNRKKSDVGLRMSRVSPDRNPVS